MLVYLHGFNSSPQSHKAQVLGRYMEEQGLGREYACPALPMLASEAISVCEALVRRSNSRLLCFVGSSLGGFYATWLAEKHDARAVLINPAIDPHVGLRAYLGKPIKKLNATRGFDHWLEIYGGYLPSSRMRWCTRMLKIKPSSGAEFDALLSSDDYLQKTGH